MRVYVIKARFTGLYEWGTGWLSDRIAESWHDYFANLGRTVKPAFWSYFERSSVTTSEYLVSVGGSVFLHPMDVTYVGHSVVVSRRMSGHGVYEDTFPEIDELKEILTGAANACGGIVEFSDIALQEMEEPKYVKGEASEVAKLP